MRSRRAPRLPRPAPRSALRRLGHDHPRARHRPERHHVQRAARGGTRAAALCPAAGTGTDQHPPHRAEPVGRLVARQHPRLGRPERDLRGHDLLSPNRGHDGHVRGDRRAAAGAGRTRRARVLRAPRDRPARRSNLLARRVRTSRARRRAERRTVAGAVRGRVHAVPPGRSRSRARITSSSASCRGRFGCPPGTRASGGPCRSCRRGRR